MEKEDRATIEYGIILRFIDRYLRQLSTNIGMEKMERLTIKSHFESSNKASKLE